MPRAVAVRLDEWGSASLIGDRRPRISWAVEQGGSISAPARAEIELSTSSETALARIDTMSFAAEWPFAPLESRDVGELRIRVGSVDEEWGPWSEPFVLLAGLFDPADWSARFVTPASIGARGETAPVVSRTFILADPPARATLWTSALGVYEVHVNGERVGDEVFAPGWRPYDRRLPYLRHSVESLLRVGENRIDVLLGAGWYRGQLTWEMIPANYGEQLAALVQLEIDDRLGRSTTIASDESWVARESGILADDFYDGEVRDLRRPLLGAGEGSSVTMLPRDMSTLTVSRAPAIRVTERIAPVAVSASPDGGTMIDFGQVLVGWVSLDVLGGAVGQEVTIRHAEVLESGRLCVRPLGRAKATCTYILDGSARRTLRPTFTFSGFRYVEIAGVEPERMREVAALVLGTDLVRTGWFECSDARLNRLHENAVWSARGNFLGVPTDCPQRAERLGWTGDIQAFAPTATLLFDMSGFLADWLEDLALEQKPDGRVPHVVPDVYPAEWVPSAGWGDAATFVPAALFEAYGDDRVLARQFDSMRRWVDYVARTVDEDGVWRASDQIGDWLDPDAPPEDPGAAKADPDVVATAYFARSARIVADAAAVLGRTADAARYGALSDRARADFARAFVSRDGRIRSDCQTVYALALGFSLIVDEDARRGAGQRLSELVASHELRIGTGFLGTPWILEALTAVGRIDLAYGMLTQTECPSWLYPVEMGATTIWERWDSLLPDGSVNPGSMTSFNHYAYGCVLRWMYRHVAGLVCIEPGYRRFDVRPLPGGGITSARMRHVSPLGAIEVAWRLSDGRFALDVVVPLGSAATVVLPDGTATEVGPGRHEFETAEAVVVPPVVHGI